MQYTIRDKTIALCGIFQAARLVQQVARTGMCDQAPYEASIKSIFKLDSATPEDVYDNSSNVLYGARTLLAQLGPDKPASSADRAKDIEVTKYCIGVMVLERKLIKRKDLLDKITEGVRKATAQLTHFNTTHENVIANLADVYTQTISTLNPRIIVNGEHSHISNPANANKIRALLLSAIRSAVLWRQCGGTRWQLLLNRKAVLDATKKLLEEHSSRILH
ncbi:MAG: high frequency lysogenization protein HflD [Gammaproteobacteria bacterium]|nr:high frequency lysogenization protein HflD [Gammaproteobacteria bacterium]